MLMNTHLEVELARMKLSEAREWATQQAILESLKGPRQPMRVAVGLGLVRVGRWLAGPAEKSAGAHGRAIA